MIEMGDEQLNNGTIEQWINEKYELFVVIRAVMK